MSFFRNFPRVNYLFGNETSTALFQNITAYIDLIDQVSDDTSFYEKYTIIDGERPDTLSYKLYGTVDYYWSFFLLNEKIRIQGWPLTTQQIYQLAPQYYPHTTLMTTESLHGEFYKGHIVATQNLDGTYGDDFKGKIIEKSLDLGQITVKPINEVVSFSLSNVGSGYLTPPTVTLTGGGGNGASGQVILGEADDDGYASISEIVVINGGDDYESAPTVTISEPDLPRGVRATATATLSSNRLGNNTVVYTHIEGVQDTRLWPVEDPVVRSAFINTSRNQYEAVHHYEDADGNVVDLPINTSGVGVDNRTSVGLAGKTAVTNLERLRTQNDDLSQIKVFKPEVAAQVDIEFQKLLKQR